MKYLAILLFPTLAFASSGTPKVAHHFKEPVLGQYSVEGACEPIHDPNSPTVTLDRGELLQDALARLPAEGGVIEIPLGFATICDSLRIRDYYPSGITLRGVSGYRKKAGFYCRSNSENFKLGGYIDHDKVAPEWLFTTGTNVFIENLEIDGYKGAVKLGSTGRHVIRNSYMHHGPHNGISSVNTGGGNNNPYDGIEDSSRFSLEMCGSEVSHYGQGNHTHNLYMHRGLGGGGDVFSEGFDTWSKVTIVDSFIHSAGWASNIKSIANENVIVNNVIMSNNSALPATEDKTRFHAQMLIDVPACSINTIEGNVLENFKPTRSAGGSALIGLRNRRTAMRGCDIPFLWSPYTLADSPWPIAKDPNHPAHTETWWAEQNKAIWFPTLIKNNQFSVEGAYSHRQSAIHRFFTTPVYEGPKKVDCLLPKPNAWYERSEVTMEGNTFEGFNPLKILIEKRRFHHENCPVMGE